MNDMQIRRLVQDQLLNNAALTAAGTLLLLLALAVLLAPLVGLAQRGAKAARSEAAKGALGAVARSIRVFGTATALVAVIAGCSILAVATYTRTDLQDWVDRGAAMTSGDLAGGLLRGLGALAGFLLGLLLFRRALRAILSRLEARLTATEALAGQAEPLRQAGRDLQRLLTAAVVYAALRLGTGRLGLGPGLSAFLITLTSIPLIVYAAQFAVLAVGIATEALDRLGLHRLDKSRLDAYYKGLRGLWPLARRVFEAVAYLAGATLLVQEFESLERFAPYGPRFMRLLAIFLGARILVELSRVAVQESFAPGADVSDQTVKRRKTLVSLVQSVAKYAIYIGAVLMMLPQLGLDPTPLLAGAGMIGLAIGLGGQRLVADMVSGFFLLFEEQILAGDYVQIGNAEGIVEGVHLRVTKIRDSMGRVHTLRNGDITTTINYSRDYIFAVVDVSVAYESDLDAVFEAVREASRRVRAALPKEVVGDTQIKGLDKFEDSGLLIQTATKTVPGEHKKVQRAFRKILKEVFDERGIEIPYPRLVIQQGTAAAEPHRAAGAEASA